MMYNQEQYDSLLAVCRSYKQDVERLTEERNRYAETLAKYQMASDKEIIAQKEEAVKEFAEKLKMVLYYEFDEIIPSIVSNKIDELIKESSKMKER